MTNPRWGCLPFLTKQIFNIIRDINQEGVTVLLVEQNVNMAWHADFALLMENGRIVRADTPEALLEDEDVKRFYLGIDTDEERRPMDTGRPNHRSDTGEKSDSAEYVAPMEREYHALRHPA